MVRAASYLCVRVTILCAKLRAIWTQTLLILLQLLSGCLLFSLSEGAGYFEAVDGDAAV